MLQSTKEKSPLIVFMVRSAGGGSSRLRLLQDDNCAGGDSCVRLDRTSRDGLSQETEAPGRPYFRRTLKASGANLLDRLAVSRLTTSISNVQSSGSDESSSCRSCRVWGSIGAAIGDSGQLRH